MISGKYQIKKLTKTYIEPGNPLWSFKAYDHTELAREVFISPKSLSHYKASCDYVIRWYIICIKNASENLCYLWAACEQGPVFSCGIEAALVSDVIFFTRVSIFISLFILSLSLSMVIKERCENTRKVIHNGKKRFLDVRRCFLRNINNQLFVSYEMNLHFLFHMKGHQNPMCFTPYSISAGRKMGL